MTKGLYDGRTSLWEGGSHRIIPPTPVTTHTLEASIVKAANQSKSTNVLAADSELTFTGAASTWYQVNGQLIITGTGTCNFEYAISGAVGSTAYIDYHQTSASTKTITPLSGGTVLNLVTGSTASYTDFNGTVLVGSATDTISPWWGQDVLQTGFTVTVLAGSWIHYKKLT